MDKPKNISVSNQLVIYVPLFVQLFAIFQFNFFPII